MCEMTEPLHGTGKIVSMDSGFCVTAGILHLHNLGVYGQALQKKLRYWPRNVPGDQIDRYFEGKPLGHCESLQQDMEGIPFLCSLLQGFEVRDKNAALLQHRLIFTLLTKQPTLILSISMLWKVFLTTEEMEALLTFLE